MNRQGLSGEETGNDAEPKEDQEASEEQSPLMPSQGLFDQAHLEQIKGLRSLQTGNDRK